MIQIRLVKQLLFSSLSLPNKMVVSQETIAPISRGIDWKS